MSDLQRLLVDACHAEDPWRELQRLSAEGATPLTAEERAALSRVDADALRMTALIVKKLRVERLVRGDPSLQFAADVDPAPFLAEYRRYARAIPPHAWFPTAEAAAFHAWRAGTMPP